MRFPELSAAGMEKLSRALLEGRLTPPWTAANVGAYISRGETVPVLESLERLEALALSPVQLGKMLELLAAERRAAQAAHDRVELVWSGPKAEGSRTRDTAVVVRELFKGARRSVLISSYGVDHGEKALKLFRPLAENLEGNPGLKARMYLNIRRVQGSHAPDEQLIQAFAAEFRERVWPGKVLPEVYYDPRALAPPAEDRACLHAKCVVVDDARAFVTSANFTEAAQVRNYEAGVLLTDGGVARKLRLQFEKLVETGALMRVV